MNAQRREHLIRFYSILDDFEYAIGGARKLADSSGRCLRAFYHSAIDSCLEIEARSTGFLHQAPGLAACDAAKAIEARQQAWVKRLPEDSEDLWDVLIALDAASRAALFAHCAALTVNAVHDPYRRSPRRLAHADRVAGAIGLDVAAHWTPKVENYLGRVTKTRILEAVREAKGEAAARSSTA